MDTSLEILILTAASIAFIHTITGPDHYIPFVVLAKARKWNTPKTIFVVTICGIGHVGSSVILGLLGVVAGVSLNKLTWFEGIRGNIAAWLIILFGLIYGIWGLFKAYKGHTHSHTKLTAHSHGHNDKVSYKQLTPWLLFLIFFFGPCEPLIPLLMYPAAKHSMANVILIASIFGLITIGTMLVTVLALLNGINLIRLQKFEKYTHIIAGFTILLSGLGILLLGL